MAKCRDFSDGKLKKMADFYKKYFDEYKGLSFWDKMKYYFGFYDLDFGEDYKRFIKSCSKTEQTTYAYISKVWRGVKATESKYKVNFDGSKEFLHSYNEIIKKLYGAISFENFSTDYDFETLINDCTDDYLNIVNAKAEAILEKDVSQWSDEDWELVSYAYCHSKDSKFKEKVINSFATDVTDEHVKNKSNKDKYYHYYEFNEKELARFREYCDYYYVQAYEKYLNTDYSNLSEKEREKIENEINTVIENYITINSFDADGYFWVEGKHKPIVIEEGKIKYKKAKYSYINIDMFGNETDENGLRIKEFDDSYKCEYYSINIKYDFYNGSEAESYLENEDNIDRFTDKKIDWNEQAAKAFKKYANKAIESIVPGWGTATKVIDVMEKVADTVAEIDSTMDEEWSKTTLPKYARWFELKVAINDEGKVSLYPTPTTKNLIKYIISYMRKNGYRNLYEKYRNYNIPEDFCNGTVNIDEFYNDMISNNELWEEIGNRKDDLDENSVIFEGEK